MCATKLASTSVVISIMLVSAFAFNTQTKTLEENVTVRTYSFEMPPQLPTRRGVLEKAVNTLLKIKLHFNIIPPIFNTPCRNRKIKDIEGLNI